MIRWKLLFAFLTVIFLTLLSFHFLSFLPSLFVSIFLSAGIGAVFFGQSYQALREITQITRLISEGDFSQKIHFISRDEIGTLARAINEMSQNLTRQQQNLVRETNQFKTILQEMIEGILITDSQGGILLINPSFQDILGIKGNFVGRPVLECIRNQEIYSCIEKALKTHQPQKVHVQILVDSQIRYLDAHTVLWGFQGLQQGMVVVIYDITDIKKLEDVRKEFVANVSHELKTPLTSVLGYAETLLNGALTDTKAARPFVEKIQKNATQLKSLVEDILKLSEIESGQMEVHYEQIFLQEMIGNLTREFIDKASQKQIHLIEKIDSHLETIKADPNVLRHVLSNLIDNAIKYISPQGEVTIWTKSFSDHLQIGIKDNGIGISKEDLPRIFERFYRVDKARSRAMGGTGLGLAIVKHLIQIHGGKITVTSHLNEGSEFIIHLPY